MSKDLEETLDEMGPEYRAVVARLRAAYEDAGEATAGRGLRIGGWLVAASLLFLLGMGVFFWVIPGSRAVRASLARAPHEYVMSVEEMIASQNADGSWQNDFLTRRNAEALRVCSTPAARIAYKKALRNLRSKGVL